MVERFSFALASDFGVRSLAVCAARDDSALTRRRRSTLERRGQREVEVVRSDVHAAFQIKAMRGESLHPGIQSKMLASLLLRVFDEPVEKHGAKSARAVGIVRDKIIDVKGAAREKEVQDAKPGHGTDDTVQLEKSEMVPLRLLLQHSRGEIDRLDVRTQFTHDGATPADLFGGVREADSPCSFRSGHAVSSLEPG